MKLKISHLTRYDYDREVSFSPHRLYLRPRDSASVRVTDFRLNLSPDAKVVWTRDPHDNVLAWAHFWERSSSLGIRAEFVVDTSEKNPFDFILTPDALAFPFDYDERHRLPLAPCLAPPAESTRVALHNWLDEHFVDRPADTVSFLVALNNLVHQSLRYARRHEQGIQSPTTTLGLASGSCRDYAVLLVELCRCLGLAARFVSGYLFDPSEDAPGHAAMHAWTEVYLPGAGWKGLDPTHGVFCDECFVPVAHAAVAETINPIQGSYFAPDPVQARLHHTVLVEPCA